MPGPGDGRPTDYRRLVRLFSLFACLLLLASCSPAEPPAVTPRLLNVYVSSAAYPRAGELYPCAPSSIVIALSDPNSAELTIRLGEPSPLTTPAYQVGTEDVLIVNHPQAGVGPLTLEQVRDLFSGRIANWKDVGGNDVPVEVWSFAQGEDIRQVFDRAVMQGQPVTSGAWLAVSAQAMSDVVGSKPGSVGYLPRRWKAGNTREALQVATVPVLAITRAEPDAAVKTLIACLQNAK